MFSWGIEAEEGVRRGVVWDFSSTLEFMTFNWEKKIDLFKVSSSEEIKLMFHFIQENIK